MKKIISVILAAFLLLASGCSVSEVPQSTQSTQSTKSSDAAVVKTTAKAQALAQAELPSQAPYPDVSAFTGSGDRFDSKGYEAANEAYIKDVMARREAGTEYGGELDEFFAKCAAQLLAEAGEDNSICSPVNIFAAMAMLAELTDGQSRRQIRRNSRFMYNGQQFCGNDKKRNHTNISITAQVHMKGTARYPYRTVRG